MEPIAAEGPNAAQIEYWNEVSGARWVEMNEIIDAQLVPLGDAAIEAAGAQPGMRVLDVGCGCGQTTLQLAERVGPSGAVVGLDISAVMLARAEERANEAGLGNVAFRVADAQTEVFAGDFDLVFSRFGVMFFASPETAFANLRTALRPGGRLTALTWQPLPLNDWMFIPMQAAGKVLAEAAKDGSGSPPAPQAPPDPHAPGPFALADSERMNAILSRAGFEQPQHTSIERELLVGGGRSLDETAAFVSQLGPGGAALREASPALREKVVAAVRAALEPFAEAGGSAADAGVKMRAAAWLVTANQADR